MGNKILRQRLRGPSLVKYYPPRGPDLNTLAKAFKPYNLEVINDEEDDRQEHLAGQVFIGLRPLGGNRLTLWQIKITREERTKEEEGCLCR